jgi:hypothetical protein
MGGVSLDAATSEVALAAVNAGIRAFAEVKDLLLSARRVPQQGNGRCGCGTGNSSLSEKDVVRLSVLLELLANFARSAADAECSVGGVEKIFARSGEASKFSNSL